MAILFLSSKRATTVPNKLIDGQYYKQLRRKTLTAFHSLLHFTLTTTWLNLSFLKTLNYSKTIQYWYYLVATPLISFKRDKNLGNFLVRSSFQTNDQSGTFKCACSQCKTCPFIHNIEKMMGPKRSIMITDHLTRTSANVIYCITYTYYNKLYIGETGRQLGDRFLISGQFGKLQNTRTKNLSSKLAFVIPTVSMSAFHSTNLFLFSCHHTTTNSVSPLSAYKPTNNPQFLQSLGRSANA